MSQPQAGLKLREAEYFLDQMRKAQNLLDEDLYKYNLSAFLSALNSVPEFLLFDFAEKNPIGISRQDEGKVYLKDFDVAAKAQKAIGKTEASEFMEFWHKWHDDLKKHVIAARRNNTIHRGYPKLESKVGEVEKVVFVPTGTFQVSTSGVSAILAPTYSPTFGSAVSTVTAAAGSQSLPSAQTYTFPPAPAGVRETYRFSDQHDKEAIDICQEAYNDMKTFVEEAQSDKWKQKQE